MPLILLLNYFNFTLIPCDDTNKFKLTPDKNIGYHAVLRYSIKHTYELVITNQKAGLSGKDKT